MARLGRARPFPPIIKTQHPIYVPPDDGVCWGHDTPNAGEDPVTWQVWQSALGVPLVTSGDRNWGEAVVSDGTPIVSQVVDTLDPNSKTFTVTRNKYGSGDAAAVSIRGSASPFGAFDASPSWTPYSVATSQAWRFVQLKIEFAP